MIPTIDSHDQLLYPRLSKYIPELEIGPLNPDKPDMLFNDWDSREIGLSFKHVSELTPGLEPVMEQLQRDVKHVDRLYLIVTGVLVPWLYGSQSVDNETGQSWWQHGPLHLKQLAKSTPYQFSYLGYCKWKHDMALYGIDVLEAPNTEAQCVLIRATYDWHQVSPDQHNEMDKPHRTKKIVPDMPSMVMTLMNLADLDTGRTFTGSEIAYALHGRFRTMGALLQASDMDIMETVLPSGKRKVGPAWTGKFRRVFE